MKKRFITEHSLFCDEKKYSQNNEYWSKLQIKVTKYIDNMAISDFDLK